MFLKNNWIRVIGFTVFVGVLITVLGVVSIPSARAQDGGVQVDYQTVLLVSLEFQSPIFEALLSNEELVSSYERFTVTALRLEGDWVEVILVPSYIVEARWEIEYSSDEIIMLLGNKDSNDEWVMYSAGSNEYALLLSNVPDSFLQAAQLNALASNHLFPWTNGQEWYKTQGWHLGDAIDFQPVVRTDPSVHFAVLASEAGALSEICNDGTQSMLQVSHSDGTTQYLHLDAGTIARELLGQNVVRGQYLGLLYNGTEGGHDDYQYDTPCGYGTAVHLHFVFPNRTTTIDGYNANDVSSSQFATKYRSSNIRVDGSSGDCDESSVPSGYVKCADETGYCSFSGTKSVYYGSGSCYAVESHSNGVNCTNSEFGDPTPGVSKACYIEGSSSSCPSVSGEVRLYDGTNCGGGDPFTAGGTGLWNLASSFNDRAESIAIPSNWSARVYLHDSESSADKCYSSTDTDFWNDTFSDGTVVANETTYMRVYDNTTCSGSTGSWAYRLYSMGDFNGGSPYESNQSIMDLSSVGWNDRTESIKINSGYEIVACAHSDLGDPCGRATGPAEYGDINALAQGLRDGLSSIRVCVGSCPSAPSAPSLNSPSNGSSNPSDYNLSFQWNASSGATEYLVEWWGGPYSTMQPCGWSSSRSCSVGNVTPGHTYSWHVKARNNEGESGWSDTWSFTIEEPACTPPSAPPAPTLVSPANGSTINSTTPTLDWGDISSSYCVDYYNIQVFENGGGQVLSETVGSEYQVPSGKLAFGKSYTWYVWAHNSIDFGNPLVATFNVETCATPGTVTLTSPENNETTASTTPIFYWNASSNSDWYELQYSVNQDFSNSSSIYSTQPINEIWPEELDDGTYYWRVRGQNTTGTCNLFGSWSSSRYFHVVTSPPDTPSNLHQSSNTQDSISIAWNDGFGETGYKIYKWGWDGTEWRFIYHDTVNENITSYTDTNLTCGADYYWYEISAYNNYGESGHTNFIQGTTDACPLNDDFDHAIDLSLHSTVTLDTHGTTQDPDDPAIPNCNMNAGRATVWFKYKPSSDSAISLDTKTSNYDTFIAVWTGTRTNLSPVVCNDDIDHANGILQSAVAFRVQKDVTYYIEVGEWDWYYEASANALGAKERNFVPTFPPLEMTPEKMKIE